MSLRRRRLLALAVLVVALAPATWLREPEPPRIMTLDLQVRRLAVPPRAVLAPHLGVLRLEAIWQLSSRRKSFGGFSSLLPARGGRMLAFSDRGYALSFALPGAPQDKASFGRLLPDTKTWSEYADVESATRDPRSGTLWIASEGDQPAIVQLRPGRRPDGVARPEGLRAWDGNAGAEAMVRLADGRFVVLREGVSDGIAARRHEALLFAGDPVDSAPPKRFSYLGTPAFSPVDMAQLPDGRVLILERRLVWPYPPRFAGRIVLADPDRIEPGKAWRGRIIAHLSSSLPIDNFEGMTVEPGPDGRAIVWLVSDDNGFARQRTLLWKLTVDPATLPQARQKARGPAARP